MALILTKEEEDMLAGKQGPGKCKCMDLMVQMAEVFDAKRMIEITSSHLIPYEMMSASRPGMAPAIWFEDWVKEMTEGVETFRVAATINPAVVKPERAKEMGFCELEIDPTQNVERGMAIYKKLGAVPAYTCCPFFVYTPRLGEHMGGAESVAVVFNNAFFGARVNRESGPTALAAAVTGRVPEFGMHLPANRYGELSVEIDKGLKPEAFDDADYNAVAYYVGEMSRDRIPVFSGLSPKMDLTDIKYLCAPLGVSAGLPLCHIVGVTPEAPTLQAAFGGRKPLDKLEFGKQELENAYGHPTSATDDRVDLSNAKKLHMINSLSGLFKGL
jgi:predicted aconitase